MYKRTKSFFNKKETLNPSQYGFREKHSTQQAIIDIASILFRQIWPDAYICAVSL